MTPAGKLGHRQVQTIVAFKRLTDDEIACVSRAPANGTARPAAMRSRVSPRSSCASSAAPIRTSSACRSSRRRRCWPGRASGAVEHFLAKRMPVRRRKRDETQRRGERRPSDLGIAWRAARRTRSGRPRRRAMGRARRCRQPGRRNPSRPRPQGAAGAAGCACRYRDRPARLPQPGGRDRSCARGQAPRRHRGLASRGAGDPRAGHARCTRREGDRAVRPAPPGRTARDADPDAVRRSSCRAICGRERRLEIEALLRRGLREGYGAIIDFPGLRAAPDAVLAEVATLQARWDALREKARGAEPPARARERGRSARPPPVRALSRRGPIGSCSTTAPPMPARAPGSRDIARRCSMASPSMTAAERSSSVTASPTTWRARRRGG